ncbi:MAG: hypothetical protein ACK559_18660, partial [bacterium]
VVEPEQGVLLGRVGDPAGEAVAGPGGGVVVAGEQQEGPPVRQAEAQRLDLVGPRPLQLARHGLAPLGEDGPHRAGAVGGEPGHREIVGGGQAGPGGLVLLAEAREGRLRGAGVPLAAGDVALRQRGGAGGEGIEPVGRAGEGGVARRGGLQPLPAERRPARVHRGGPQPRAGAVGAEGPGRRAEAGAGRGARGGAGARGELRCG